MSDPKRWRSASSDAPGEARALLLAARPAPPLTPELRAASAEAVRTLAAQGVSATLLGSATVKLGLAIVGSFVVWWVEKRLAFRIWWRNAMAESKQRPNRPGATA